MFTINDPLNHFFDIKFDQEDLSIESLDAFDFSILNPTYNSRFLGIDKNGANKNVTISVLLDDITQELIDLLIYTEDPNFYAHKGIDPFFVGVAIVSNIKKNSFFKGGSTITMQLTRNLFLNHSKNILRKVEEIVIALLIENYLNIPKRRILELYLNIIEFGPGVYGINRASDLYFSKMPNELNLLECIVITYIVPRPKHFYEALLIQTDQLKKNLANHIQYHSERFVNKGRISREEQKKMTKKVQFSKQFGELILNIG